METIFANKKNSILGSYLFIVIVVIVTCLMLFYLDKDTLSISDLFKPVNLKALFIYFVPTFGICFVSFKENLKRKTLRKSLLSSLVFGVPVGIMSTMLALFIIMHK